MVVLDTNIVIDHLRQKGGNSKLVKFAESKVSETLAISIISIQELYEGKSTTDKKEEKLLIETLNSLKILPYTEEIAQGAGKIARDAKIKIEVADAAIAATAIINGASLYTLDRQDFSSIPDLKLE
ncbi:PIN domain-containing protein [Candidatus Gottesmanbacteria bacterium]|nr:PIN domain-containing protein [Candidatus Gottesmanbacteria bacterium]